MSKRLIKIAVLVFLGVLLAILPLVACDEECDEEEEITITIEQLTQEITEAADDMETYQFDVKRYIEHSIENDTETREYKLSIEGNCIVDSTNKKMQYTESREGESPEGTPLKEIEAYFIGDMMYTKTVTPGMPEEWIKEAMTAESWGQLNLFEHQMESLKVSEIEILGSEKVNGVDCWVIKVMPTALEEPINYNYWKQWFAKDTYYLMKAKDEAEWTLPDIGLSAFSRSEIECSHHNEPVSIELPPEAAEAEEVE